MFTVPGRFQFEATAYPLVEKIVFPLPVHEIPSEEYIRVLLSSRPIAIHRLPFHTTLFPCVVPGKVLKKPTTVVHVLPWFRE
jgi:hypothetical protein